MLIFCFIPFCGQISIFPNYGKIVSKMPFDFLFYITFCSKNRIFWILLKYSNNIMKNLKLDIFDINKEVEIQCRILFHSNIFYFQKKLKIDELH